MLAHSVADLLAIL